MTRRTERINHLIRAEISDLMLREVKDPRLSGLVTITEVDTAPDLRTAKVFISVLGTEEDKKKVLQGLTAAGGFMRHELAERLTMRIIPQLYFCLDQSIEHGAEILNLIKQVCPPEEPPPETQGTQKKG